MALREGLSMSGVELAAGAAIVGTATSVYGQIKGAQAQSEANEAKANLQREEADELLDRQAMNEKILRQNAAQAGLEYSATVGSNGLDQSGIGGLLTIQKNLDQTVSDTRREADFKAKMLRAGADIETGLASDMVTASYIAGGGNILGAAAKGYSAFKPPGTPTSLPQV